jgi:hypothetical protein
MTAGFTLTETRIVQGTRRLFHFETLSQLIVLILGARCAYAGRNLPVGADGLAYLEVARAYVRHDWHAAINGYWGPLYSWLLAIVMWAFHPRVGAEFALARSLNFILFATALYTFSRYWHAVAQWSSRISRDHVSIPSATPFVWVALGYLLFAVNFLWSVDVVNPDILVAVLVFAIATSLFNLDHGAQVFRDGLAKYAFLGLLLAVGYYAKAILLYFAIFVSAVIVSKALRSRHILGPVVTVAVFAALVLPFVLILSRAMGHVTANDSGRLNYAWFVDGPETKTWMKDSNGDAPIPFYPGPILFTAPRVFRVPLMEGIAYAPWYDAARFNSRARPTFNLRYQFSTIGD